MEQKNRKTHIWVVPAHHKIIGPTATPYPDKDR